MFEHVYPAILKKNYFYLSFNHCCFLKEGCLWVGGSDSIENIFTLSESRKGIYKRYFKFIPDVISYNDYINSIYGSKISQSLKKFL